MESNVAAAAIHNNPHAHPTCKWTEEKLIAFFVQQYSCLINCHTHQIRLLPYHPEFDCTKHSRWNIDGAYCKPLLIENRALLAVTVSKLNVVHEYEQLQWTCNQTIIFVFILRNFLIQVVCTIVLKDIFYLVCRVTRIKIHYNVK